MKELKCPQCGNVFTVDENDYAALLNQVKNAEFERVLSRRIHELEQVKNSEVRNQLSDYKLQLQTLQSQLQQADQAKQLAVAQVRQQATEAYMKKEQELAQVRTQMDAQLI